MLAAAEIRGVVMTGATTAVKLAVTGDAWAYLTVLATTSGGRVATKPGVTTKSGTGFPIPVDTAVTFLLPPGTTVYAVGSAGALVGVATQPVPWPARLWLTLEHWLAGASGGRLAA